MCAFVQVFVALCALGASELMHVHVCLRAFFLGGGPGRRHQAEPLLAEALEVSPRPKDSRAKQCYDNSMRLHGFCLVAVGTAVPPWLKLHVCFCLQNPLVTTQTYSVPSVLRPFGTGFCGHIPPPPHRPNNALSTD